MDLFQGGKFAIGFFLATVLWVVIWLFFSTCDSGPEVLWFCGEDNEIVLATLRFWNELVDSLAWPLLVLFVILIFWKTSFSCAVCPEIKEPKSWRHRSGVC